MLKIKLDNLNWIYKFLDKIILIVFVQIFLEKVSENYILD